MIVVSINTFTFVLNSLQISAMQPPEPASGTSQHAALFSGKGVSFLEGPKLPGREADHSLPFTAEDNKERSYTSTSTTRLHGVHTKTTLFSYTFSTCLILTASIWSPNRFRRISLCCNSYGISTTLWHMYKMYILHSIRTQFKSWLQ